MRFFYLGRLVDDSSLAATEGIGDDYFDFAAIGVLLLVPLITTLTAFSRRIREDQTNGTLEALLSTPVSPALLIVSTAAYNVLRACVSALFVLALAVVIFGFQPGGGLTSAAVVLAAGPALMAFAAAVGICLAACTVIFKEVSVLLGILTSAIALLSNGTFPSTSCPRRCTA